MKLDGRAFKGCHTKSIIVLIIILAIGVSGCSLFRSSGPESKNVERTIWHSREQNVRIVPPDVRKGAASVANDQPVMLEPGQIRRALASLEVQLPKEEKLVPVFTKPELDLLCGKLSEGLAQAGPNEDISFVSVGDRKAIYGLAKQQKVTTGRVFYQDGKLNIIFGKMVDDLKPVLGDYRLNPLTPGSRLNSISHEWVLEDEPDMQFHAEGGMVRTDWVMLDLASMAAHEALGIKPAITGRTVSETTVKVPERTVAPREGSQLQTPTVTQAPQTGKTSKTIEERLLILNNLKNKKLITEEEYKKKRAEILNEL